VVNLRAVCDSTVLFDRQTRVSPKLDEFAEFIPELIGGAESPGTAGPGLESQTHKVVVFSQWETMVFEAAKVLDRLGVGYAVLHGGLSGKDRKAALEQFKTDPACRVFLSTDAGGTGLNLQNADTVVNLELPWNPAVLEQRIARVHRMGQSRPVRVVNLVTRGTIEEKVLRTLEAKQGLFTGIFEGDEDEIPFEAARSSGFLDAMRGLIGEQPRGQESEVRGQKTEDRGQKNAEDRRQEAEDRAPTSDLWTAATHLLEGVSALLAASQPIPDDVRGRLREVVQALSARLGDAPSHRS
jgi:superfamily II DNA/RNA helicase